ncbi:coth protein-domain-containing protein [Spinellus fusiger]|nr:coth protein-domain-containing protein [Spinellus fusiger]
MLLPFLIFSLLSAVIAYAQTIEYRVVVNTMEAINKVGVLIGPDVYPLLHDPNIPLLYTGSGPGGVSYRYVIFNDPETRKIVDYEKFQRPAIVNEEATVNEVFGRPWNALRLSKIPTLYNDLTNYNPSKLFDDGIIATLHFQANEDDIENMHNNKMKKIKVSGKMTYISPTAVYQIDNVKIKVGGHSSRKWAKVPYKIKLPKTAPYGLYNRWDLKLRPSSTDPSMMREKLYSDLLQSSGVAAARGSYVRVYMNDMPVGLYLITDDSGSKSFIREAFHNGNRNVALGERIQGDAGKGDYAANLNFFGDSEDLYDDRVYSVKTKSAEKQSHAMDHLIDFMKFIQDYDPEQTSDIEEAISIWEPKLDIVRFLRQMALEWVGGNWDAIQYSGNNYILYRDPDSEQYKFVPMDFDYTFGNGLEEDQAHLMTGHWDEFTEGRIVHSYLWEKIKDTPHLMQMYESFIQEINESVSCPEVLLSRVDSLAYMLMKDVEWDKSLERLTTGKVRPFDDYLTVIEEGNDYVDGWIGLKEWIRAKNTAISEINETSGSD